MLQHAVAVVGVAGVRELVLNVRVPESFKLDYDTGSVCLIYTCVKSLHLLLMAFVSDSRQVLSQWYISFQRPAVTITPKTYSSNTGMLLTCMRHRFLEEHGLGRAHVYMCTVIHRHQSIMKCFLNRWKVLGRCLRGRGSHCHRRQRRRSDCCGDGNG